ncbi:MAG: hypothetical protein WCQ41_05050 [Bacillota bacterium]
MKFSHKKGSIVVESAIIFPAFVIIFVVFALIFRVIVSTTNLKHIALTNADSFSSTETSLADEVKLFVDSKKQWVMGEGNVKVDGPNRRNGRVEVLAKGFVVNALPLFNFDKVLISQKGISLDWYEDDKGNAISEENVWRLSPFSRGKAIQKHYGRNLPEFFPTYCIFEGGKGVSILSIDVTNDTYLRAGEIEKTIEETINEVKTFSGGENAGITLSAAQITSKEIWIVVPEGSLSAAQENEISESIASARVYGITIRLLEFQKKE